MAPWSHLDRRTFLGGLGGIAAGSGLFLRHAKADGTKTLVGVIEEDPPSMNPGIISTLSAYESGGPVYSGLAWADVNGKLQPDLAESWEVSADGLVYTFHLRHGVLWHDGKPFTAADAVFSLGQLTAKMHPSAKLAYKFLDSFETPDDYTLLIKMKRPIASFLNVPTSIWPILPKHLWEGADVLKNPYNHQPVGTGPFMFKEYQPGQQIRYVRNPNYFIKGQPAYDELIIRIIPDASARISAFESGEVDFLQSSAVPSTEIARLLKEKAVAGFNSTLPGGAWLGIINSKSTPYGDVRVRQALAHSIDKTLIRNAVLPGIAQNMVGPLPPSSPLYNSALKDYDLDPALANKMLDDAGYKKNADGMRFDFRLLYSANDIRVVRMGEIIAQNLKGVGINTVLQPLDRSAINQLGYIQGKFDMIIDSYGLGPDPDVGVERLYNSNNIVAAPFVNNSGYSNPAVDKLFEQQGLQSTPESRKAVYDKIQELIWADIPIFPICAYTSVAIYHGDTVKTPFVTWNSLFDSFGFAVPV